MNNFKIDDWTIRYTMGHHARLEQDAGNIGWAMLVEGKIIFRLNFSGLPAEKTRRKIRSILKLYWKLTQ